MSLRVCVGFISDQTNPINIWYPHQPNNVEENEDQKILWNFPIRTDHEIHRYCCCS